MMIASCRRLGERGTVCIRDRVLVMSGLVLSLAWLVSCATGQRGVQDSCKVDGTVAAGQLLHDVCHTLWKYESIDHRDCVHSITGAKPLEAADSLLVTEGPPELRAQVGALRDDRQPHARDVDREATRRAGVGASAAVELDISWWRFAPPRLEDG